MTKAKSPYDIFGTSKDLEAGAGVTLEYPGFSITIHRAGGSNAKFAQALSSKMKPYRQQFERGILEDEIANKILIEAYAQAIVVGWKDVKDRNGKTMTFNYDNVVKLLTDLPDLFNDIKTQAANAAVFREEQERIDEKN